jgi:hypothetical protein
MPIMAALEGYINDTACALPSLGGICRQSEIEHCAMLAQGIAW